MRQKIHRLSIHIIKTVDIYITWLLLYLQIAHNVYDIVRNYNTSPPLHYVSTQQKRQKKPASYARSRIWGVGSKRPAKLYPRRDTYKSTYYKKKINKSRYVTLFSSVWNYIKYVYMSYEYEKKAILLYERCPLRSDESGCCEMIRPTTTNRPPSSSARRPQPEN